MIVVMSVSPCSLNFRLAILAKKNVVRARDLDLLVMVVTALFDTIRPYTS